MITVTFITHMRPAGMENSVIRRLSDGTEKGFVNLIKLKDLSDKTVAKWG